MGKLYIIATEHTDMVNGPKKLLSLYNQIRPDILLEEMNEPDLKKFHELSYRLEKKLRDLSDNQRGIDQFIGLFKNYLGFEGHVNRAYAKAQGIPNYMIDMPGGQEKLYNVLELIIQEILEKAKQNGGINVNLWLAKFLENGNKTPEEVRESWENYSAHEGKLRGELVLLTGRTLGRIGEPDKYMETRIRELYDSKKVIAFSVGMVHALESISRSTVYSRIKDLNPERIPLI